MNFNPVFFLEKWLWRQGLSHPTVLPIVRNELFGAILSLGLGLLLFYYTAWLFWFGFGFAILALTFYSLARFFLRLKIGQFTNQLLFGVLLRWGGRLLLTLLLLYFALVVCAAPVLALLAGLVAASFLALVTYAYQART
ncbi:MAG: hypothetical protein IJS50_04530 [Desulfovibrio sp.]|nr:hypothetical protein [Desulfovibrio sp.]